jgi:hypothetical protein
MAEPTTDETKAAAPEGAAAAGPDKDAAEWSNMV